MNNLVDLHTHTTKSDGTYTPNELLVEANKKGLKILSITDHECVDAYVDIDRNLFSGNIISGVEFRTSCFGISIELLGYGFDIKKMAAIIQKFNYKNTKELDIYMLNLAYEQYIKRGVKLDSNFIQDYDSNVYPRFSKYLLNCIKKYNENYKFLKDLPEGKSFFRYCMTNPESLLFLDLSTAFPTIDELISSIKDTGGLVAIPHIFEYGKNAERILNYLLDNYNIDMIECYYPTFTTDQTNYLLKICDKYDKFVSGGSDFHGMTRPKTKLGTGIDDNLNIPIEKIEKWLKYII